MRSSARRGLAIGLGGAAAATAGWIAAQRADSRAIERDPRVAELFAPFGGRRSSVRAEDGTALWVRTFGPDGAPTVVFVHGWTCSAEFWKLQLGALEGELRLVAFDLRGHGQSERPPNGNYSIETFGSDLEAVLRACVPEGGRPLVVGHSLGAMSIAAWAGEHPGQADDRLAAAVLVNTGVGDLISESMVVAGIPNGFVRLQRLAGETILKARAPIPTFSSPITHRVIRQFVVGPDATPAEVAFCERLVLSCPPEVRSAVGGTLSELDLRHALAELTVPTLVIAGSDDKLTPLAHAEEMAEALPEVVDLIELDRSGHMSPVEFPDEVSSRISSMADSHL